MEQLKLPIALVVAMVLQISGGVWWVSQQAQTIANLEATVSEMSSRMAIEENVNMKRDVEQLKKEVENIWEMENSVSMMVTEQIRVKARISVLEKELQFFERDHNRLTQHPME